MVQKLSCKKPKLKTQEFFYKVFFLYVLYITLCYVQKVEEPEKEAWFLKMVIAAAMACM